MFAHSARASRGMHMKYSNLYAGTRKRQSDGYIYINFVKKCLDSLPTHPPLLSTVKQVPSLSGWGYITEQLSTMSGHIWVHHHWSLKLLQYWKTYQQKKNWNSRISEVIMKYMNTQCIDIVSQINMRDIKKNLQESYMDTWKEQLWNDIRQSGGNKLRTYRLFKTVFAWEYYLSRITKRSHMIALARFRTR